MERTSLGRVVLLLLVVYAATSSSSSYSTFGSPYLSRSCSLATPSIPMICLLPLLTTTRLGFDASVMKEHWSTWESSTHGQWRRQEMKAGYSFKFFCLQM